MNRTDRLRPQGIPRYIRVYDNGGLTHDRYTAVFTGRYRMPKGSIVQRTGGDYLYLGMSANPFHPQGFGQHGTSRKPIDRPGYKHLGRKVSWDQLPSDVQKCILCSYNDLWGLK